MSLVFGDYYILQIKSLIQDALAGVSKFFLKHLHFLFVSRIFQSPICGALGAITNIVTGYYGQLEVGAFQMSIDTLIKLSTSMHLPMEYILLGSGYEPGDATAVTDFLKHCTPKELALAEEVLKVFLMRNNP